jgi:SAM-dependent methyltransferase
MKLIEQIHARYVENRRAGVLSKRLAELIPPGFQLLDVGCGDGFITQLVARARPDISVCGLDVLERKRSHVPVTFFDGEVIPYDDAAFDGVMFVDVLHHTQDPMVLLREAARVARKIIVIKDHLLNGLLAGSTLRFMDNVGNARYSVSLPYNYWSQQRWLEAFQAVGLQVDTWATNLGLYPWPATWICDRSLHFVSRLEVS